MDEMARGSDERADLILRGGSVWSAGWDAPVPGAVAVSAARIAFVGPEADARAWAGPDTRVVDAPGSLVVPGFQDAHCHPISSGLERLRCDLNDVFDADGYV